MNTTSTTNGGILNGYSSIGGLGYGLGVSIGVVLLITTVTLTSYYCTRSLQPVRTSRHNHRVGTANDDLITGQHLEVEAVPVGLDEATIESYLTLTYSEAEKLHGKGRDHGKSTTLCCSICLADYKLTDTLRSLPDCGHLFHQNCVDPWLRLHPTCPICRSSPMPTPLAEVVPRAGSRIDIPI